MNDLFVYLIFGCILYVILAAIFLGIRFRNLSPIKAAIFVYLYPLIFEALLFIYQKRDLLEILCVGTFLSLIFGTSTYIFGKALQKKLKTNNL
jgi:hypothetical protein